MAVDTSYVRQLKKILKGTPLAPHAALIARVEARNRLPRGIIAGIAKAESSFGTAGNPTRGFNAWGWTRGGPPNFRSFPNWQTAIRQFGRFLGQSYGQQLRSGGPEAIERRYVGYAAPHWTKNVRSVMQQVGGGIATAPPGGKSRNRGSSSTGGRDLRPILLGLLMARRSGGSSPIVSAFLMKALQAPGKGRDPISTVNSIPVGGTQMVGKRGLRLPANFTVTHETSGLPGYVAHDFLAKPNTPVGSPVDGEIIRISGSNNWKSGGIGGRSIYIRARNGRTYFLTHFGPNLKVKVGDRVRVNQILGYVGKPTSGMAPHIHLSYKD